MKSKAFVAMLVFLVFLSLSAVSYAKQLLADPGFAEGFAKWTCVYNLQNWSPLDLPGGKKALRCHWDGGMKQVVPVTAGKTYEFKGDVSVAANGDKENWGCWVSLDWYDADKKKMGTIWTVEPNQGERGKWVTYNSGKQIPPQGAAFACIEFGVWQSNATPASPVDFANFSFEEN